MTVLVSDSFNRTNSTTTLGTTDSYNGGSSLAWQNLVGTWGITNNQAYNAGNSANAVSVVDAGVSDCKVSVTVSNYSSVWKFIARASNGTNFLCVTGTSLSKVTNGSFSSLGTIPAFTTGDVLTFVLNGSSITIQKNGTTVLTVTNTFNQTATMHGLSSNNNTALYDNFQIEDLNTGGTGTTLTLSLSDSITLSESFDKVRSGKLTLIDSLTATDSRTVKSTRFLSLVDGITLTESFMKRRQAYLSLVDGLTIGDTETSTRATINTLVRALSDSINITDSITIRAMRYLTIFDLFSIVDSIGTTGGGNVAQTIKFKRGNEVDLPTLAEGEPAITMDTNKMFVGTPNGNRQIATLLVVDSVANLPIADKSKQFLISGVLGGTGTADALYVCKKLSNDTYDWVQFV
jgi:hypothetical protein